jgi:hypothetical protein
MVSDPERRRAAPCTRRRLAAASLAWPAAVALPACSPPLPLLSAAGTSDGARALLSASAAAHGGAALSRIGDVSIAYAGDWPPLIGSLQPALVDSGFRGGSEERLLLPDGIVAQAHTGPKGRKQVVRTPSPGAQGGVRVWFNGEEAQDGERRAAAALVADGYSLFLLGPMLLSGRWGRERGLTMDLGAAERITVDSRTHACDVLRLRMAPGLGFSGAEQLALFIDRDERLMRRVRFGLEGLVSTRGAVAEVDTWAHATLHGVRWPTRFHERLLRPFPLPVHEWRLAGLDVDRGLRPAEIDGPSFGGKAAVPAAALPSA